MINLFLVRLATYIDHCIDVLEGSVGQKDEKCAVYVHDVLRFQGLSVIYGSKQHGHELQRIGFTC